mmetsp:Transcript_19121/g.56781  ORF Transcript_19121/g.56781 Transcript_19121/m.56781 type:complete len:376 (+) Transcript_19121:124-1251(+)
MAVLRWRALLVVVWASALRFTPRTAHAPPQRAGKPQQPGLAKTLAHAALACALSLAPLAGVAEETSAGFEEFAAKGGTMEARPQCFFDECGDQSKACFTNPSCLKGVTCLGNCRGEQECATQCFARFGSEKLNNWLSCTLEEKSCVVTGVAQDTSSFYATAPKRLGGFDKQALDGKWWKVRGYNAKYDCFPCQANTFRDTSAPVLKNDIEFRVAKPGGAGYWQNRLVEDLVDERGPQGKASFTVGGKMYGLTFREQWYVVGQGDARSPFVLVAYKGDTQQGPYEGAFLYTRTKDAYDADAGLRARADAAAKAAGLDPAQFCAIDNACPADGVTAGGASADDLTKEKLEWSDVFDLAEWFRPGTTQKKANFDPNKM